MKMHLHLGTFLVLVTTTWAQNPKLRRELQDCGCDPRSSAKECQSKSSTLCYKLGTNGQCPAGTTPCPGVVEKIPCRDIGKGVIDTGCNETHRICVYANGGQVVGGNVGHHCALCINSIQPNDVDQVDPDEGCGIDTPVCVGSRQLASNVEGTACAVCFNSIPTALDPSDIDDGCPPTAPVCVNATGDSPAIWTPGTSCVAKCTDTRRDDGIDNGCTARYPFCVLNNGNDPGADNPGVRCSLCSLAFCDDEDPCTTATCNDETGCDNEDNGSCTPPNSCENWSR